MSKIAAKIENLGPVQSQIHDHGFQCSTSPTTQKSKSETLLVVDTCLLPSVGRYLPKSQWHHAQLQDSALGGEKMMH
jgi:hypothetical protein